MLMIVSEGNVTEYVNLLVCPRSLHQLFPTPFALKFKKRLCVSLKSDQVLSDQNEIKGGETSGALFVQYVFRNTCTNAGFASFRVSVLKESRIGLMLNPP